MKKTILKSIALFTLLCLLSPLNLQSQSVTVYKDHHYKGKSHTYTGNSPNLDAQGMNDNITSLIIRKGTKVTLYWDKGYEGAALVLYSGDGDTHHDEIDNWNDDPSSIKIEKYSYKHKPAVTFYESYKDEVKKQLLVEGDYKKSQLMCSDCFSRISIPKGVIVELFEHDNFEGKTKTLTSRDNIGSGVNLGDHNWNDKISSIKIINTLYALKSMELKNKRKIETAPEEIVGVESTTVNNLSNTSTKIVTMTSERSNSITESTSHEISHTLEIAVTKTVSAEFKLFGAEVSMEIRNSLTNSFTHGKDKTSSITQTWESSDEIPIPTGCIGTVTGWATPVTLKFDVVRTYVEVDPDGIVVPGGTEYIEESEMEIEEAINFHTVLDEICDNTATSVVNTNTNTSGNSNEGAVDNTADDDNVSSPPVAINGQNVSKVNYNTSKGSGFFKDNGDGTWTEGNDKTSSAFSFKETGRDEWSVFLRDDSRNTNIQMDLHRKKITYSRNRSAPSIPLYNISSVE